MTGSATFWFEIVVDLFFFFDIIINFRTAFIDSNGFREKKPAKIGPPTPFPESTNVLR